jgi:hypothetical protein
MKAKLIKTEVNYLLENKEGVIIASTSIKKGISSLSKQNCDEIFGSYNPESMMKDILSNCEKTKEGYILGFQMAMELNKNKVFTLEDMKKAISMARKGSQERLHDGYGNFTQPIFVLNNTSSDEIIQSLQQPTEIDVVIVTKTYMPEPKPLLDGNGRLILKKI